MPCGVSQFCLRRPIFGRSMSEAIGFCKDKSTDMQTKFYKNWLKRSKVLMRHTPNSLTAELKLRTLLIRLTRKIIMMMCKFYTKYSTFIGAKNIPLQLHEG